MQELSFHHKETIMKASSKSTALDQFILKLTGKNRVDTIARDLCMTCSDPDTEFRNAKCLREFTISGMCQRCQDEVFGSMED